MPGRVATLATCATAWSPSGSGSSARVANTTPGTRIPSRGSMRHSYGERSTSSGMPCLTEDPLHLLVAQLREVVVPRTHRHEPGGSTGANHCIRLPRHSARGFGGHRYPAARQPAHERRPDQVDASAYRLGQHAPGGDPVRELLTHGAGAR